MTTRDSVSVAARTVTRWAGSGLASVLVVVVVVAWVLVGIPWGFDEHWHQWLHSIASAVTLIMVFVIQHTTNQESRAMLVKLDELLRVDGEARSELISVENAELERQERVDQEMREHPQSAPDTAR
jgi:low affinity Fe/Cu permease